MGSYLTPADIDALNDSKLTRASPFAIRGVSHTQLSIARHYGGCRYNGESYTYMAAMMPDKALVLQGEATRTTRGVELLYTTVRRPMRVALRAEQIRAAGLQASLLLRHACDPVSYEWLMSLLDRYDGDASMSAIVEFSVYRVPVGIYADLGQNTLFWEVRWY